MAAPATVDGLFTPPAKKKKKSTNYGAVGTAAKKATSAAKASYNNSYKPKPRPAPRPAPPPPRSNPPSSPPPRPTKSAPVKTITPPKPKPPPPPPTIAAFLAGDEAYQQSIRGGQRTLEDFLSELTRERGEAQTNFQQTQSALEVDRERQLQRLKDEFAARGLLQSGIYGEEQGNFQQDFMMQQERLQQSQSQLLQDLVAQETGFRRQGELDQENARQQALARRAARYNIPF